MERKKAVVTGASRGIGNGIARCLAREGYDLAISYATKQEEAQKLANELQETYGGKCFYFQASLEKEGVGVELLKKSVEALGGLDLLVNNAGVTRFENILANRLGNIYLYSSHAFISSSSIGVVQNAVMKADARRELVTRGIFRSIAALRIL